LPNFSAGYGVTRCQRIGERGRLVGFKVIGSAEAVVAVEVIKTYFANF